jgi:hypothetical protein
MNQAGVWLEGYAISRDTLIEALQALRRLSAEGFVLVGAQAVYLRSPGIELPFPAFTLDGDVVVDPRKVRRPRAILESLEAAGFTLRGHGGLYHRKNASIDTQRATEIDLFVPARFNSDFELQGYNSRDAAAVMSQEGLELAIVDHSPLLLDAIGEKRSPLVVEVAGPTALVVAKAWKLGERYAQGNEEFSSVAKDVLDVYRLLQASGAEEIGAALQAVPREPRYLEPARKAAGYLEEILTGNGPGTALLYELLGEETEARIIAESLDALVAEFCSLVDTYLHR